MREFTIGPNDAGQRLDRWLAKTLPLLPAPLAQKYIRIKRVKCNGKGAKRDTRLVQGDVLQLYINDEFFDTPTPENAFLSVFKPQLDIVYEDENLLLVNKRPGLVVHPDEQEKVNTLLTHIQAYLYQKKEWNPRQENAFAPALCNRIDRNTGGIVIAAKNAETLRVMNQKIRDREVEKSYLCIILGAITPPAGKLEGYLLKDEAKKLVSVHKTPVPGPEKRSVPGGLPPGHRPHPPDPGPVRRRRPSPAGGREIRPGPGEQKVRPHRGPGPLLLPAGLPLHHRCRLSGRPQRPGVDRGPGGFRDRLLPPRPPAPVTGEAFSRRKILFLDRGIFFC